MAVSKKYSKSDISLHTSKEDCWLVINGKVYDVTTFLEDHPGGEDVSLQASANGDATESFEDVGHSSSATSMLEGYLIGTVGDASDSTEAQKPPASGEAVQSMALLKKRRPPSTGIADFILPVLVLAMAIAAWYYLTFIHVKA